MDADGVDGLTPNAGLAAPTDPLEELSAGCFEFGLGDTDDEDGLTPNAALAAPTDSPEDLSEA